MTDPAQTSPLFASWTALLGDSERSREVWADVVRRWSELHRRYHSLGHLVAVLGIAARYADHADDPLAVQLGGWFHDVVYDPRSSTNEADSAAYAVEALESLGCVPSLVGEVERLVRTTTDHVVAADDRNGAVLCDADLAVLGAPPAAYLSYVNAVREEYAHVPDDDFRVGRAAVLDRLLERDPIYRLEPVRAELEDTARANLTAERSLY